MNDPLREKLKALPEKPGCYLMRDRTGRIIYIGKALSLRRRLQSYFHPATLRQADPKLRGSPNANPQQGSLAMPGICQLA